jgi:hypothetical protein
MKAFSVQYPSEDVGAGFQAVLNEYREAAKSFLEGLRSSRSDYERMLVKQGYLLSTSRVLQRTAWICGRREIAAAASFLEVAAASYQDDSDRRAYEQGLYNRFILDFRNAQLLLSRLQMRAHQACSTWARYNGVSSHDPRASALRFMLEVTLDLPTGAWECACCLAVHGNCKECGYGKDHLACSLPGSTYEMLRLSQEALVSAIRRALVKDPGRADRERPRVPEAWGSHDHEGMDCWGDYAAEVMD